MVWQPDDMVWQPDGMVMSVDITNADLLFGCSPQLILQLPARRLQQFDLLFVVIFVQVITTRFYLGITSFQTETYMSEKISIKTRSQLCRTM